MYSAESHGGHTVRGEVQAGRRAGRQRRGTQRAGEGLTAHIQGRAAGGAHVEHEAHVRDAGRVEAQRLVERPRVSEHGAHVRGAGGVEAQRLIER